MKTIGIIVVIDSYLIRKGMISLLSSIHGIRIVREFSDASSFNEYAQKQYIDFQIISQSIFDRSSQLFVSRPDLLEKTILIKEEPSQDTEIHTSIYLSEEKDQIIAKIRKLTTLQPKADPASLSGELTQRERTIVRKLSQGLTNKEIAKKLFLSTHTVTTHRKNISNKLGIKSVSGLTVYAIVNNIITIEEVTSKPTQ